MSRLLYPVSFDRSSNYYVAQNENSEALQHEIFSIFLLLSLSQIQMSSS
jgi:hypothetical protein